MFAYILLAGQNKYKTLVGGDVKGKWSWPILKHCRRTLLDPQVNFYSLFLVFYYFRHITSTDV
jgi:hypothetical protein